MEEDACCLARLKRDLVAELLIGSRLAGREEPRAQPRGRPVALDGRLLDKGEGRRHAARISDHERAGPAAHKCQLTKVHSVLAGPRLGGFGAAAAALLVDDDSDVRPPLVLGAVELARHLGVHAGLELGHDGVVVEREERDDGLVVRGRDLLVRRVQVEADLVREALARDDRLALVALRFVVLVVVVLHDAAAATAAALPVSIRIVRE